MTKQVMTHCCSVMIDTTDQSLRDGEWTAVDAGERASEEMIDENSGHLKSSFFFPVVKKIAFAEKSTPANPASHGQLT